MKNKNFLINLIISFILLTILHWVFKLFWNIEGNIFVRLIIAGIIARFNPIYKPN